jgi:hypothetical protein
MPLKPLKIKPRLNAKIAEIKSLQHRYSAAQFARMSFELANGIKIRIPELEPFIFKEVWAAYEYVISIVKKPLLEAEPIILDDPWTAFHYAVKIKKERWPAAEQVLKDNQLEGFWNKYKEIFNIKD